MTPDHLRSLILNDLDRQVAEIVLPAGFKLSPEESRIWMVMGWRDEYPGEHRNWVEKAKKHLPERAHRGPYPGEGGPSELQQFSTLTTRRDYHAIGLWIEQAYPEAARLIADYRRVTPKYSTTWDAVMTLRDYVLKNGEPDSVGFHPGWATFVQAVDSQMEARTGERYHLWAHATPEDLCRAFLSIYGHDKGPQ